MCLVFLTFGAEWRMVSAVNDRAEGMNSRGVLGLPQGDGFFGVIMGSLPEPRDSHTWSARVRPQISTPGRAAHA